MHALASLVVLGAFATDYRIVNNLWYALMPFIIKKLTEVYSLGYLVGTSQDFHEIVLRFIRVSKEEIECILSIHRHDQVWQQKVHNL